MTIDIGSLVTVAIQAVVTGTSTAIGGGLGAWIVTRHLIARIEGNKTETKNRGEETH